MVDLLFSADDQRYHVQPVQARNFVHYLSNKPLAEQALVGYTLERFRFDGAKKLSDKEVATLHAKEALRLATCDGPPYYYKVAYGEAEMLLEKLK